MNVEQYYLRQHDQKQNYSETLDIFLACQMSYESLYLEKNNTQSPCRHQGLEIHQRSTFHEKWIQKPHLTIANVV